MTTSKDMQYWH